MSLKEWNNNDFDVFMTACRKCRENDYFEAKTIPYTPIALIDKMFDKIPSIKEEKFDVEIGVVYCIEMAFNLNRRGFTNITMIVGTHDEKIKVQCDKTNMKYKVININEEKNMPKFDVVVGNPPYQDGTKAGGQNKIYNQITKKSLEMLKEDGTIAFITPTSVLKKSKRFSLIGIRGLKLVDFTADDHFDVGINICSWIVDKTYNGDVRVVHGNGVDIILPETVIYDYSKVDKDFAELYTALKNATNAPDKRMFKQNNFGSAMAKNMDAIHQYQLYKMLTDNTPAVTFYSKRIPYCYNKEKFIISMTKAFNVGATTSSVKDFDLAHMFTDIENEQEVENIKSFLFSEYFMNHSQQWKDLDGYGYNYALKYLPPFDKTKTWTNSEVKEFLEGFL